MKQLCSQESCVEYIAAIRWKDGFTCPACGAKGFWKSERLIRVCSTCKVQSRVLAGTLFQDSKLPLDLWFQMMWWFMGPKNGVSALALQSNFGIGSYRTAWALLGKLRSCAVLPPRSPLSGEVEVDQVFLGGVNNKEIIGVAAEKRGLGTGRIRLKHLKNETADEIQTFILETVELGSKIISDRHKSYPSLVQKGYSYEAKKKPYFWEEVDGDDERLLPRIGRAAAHLKRWYFGTYHAGIQKAALQQYLDEFVFRYNRRTSGSRGLVFHRMVEAAVRSGPRPNS